MSAAVAGIEAFPDPLVGGVNGAGLKGSHDLPTRQRHHGGAQPP
jgi:hypothetical protein